MSNSFAYGTPLSLVDAKSVSTSKNGGEVVITVVDKYHLSGKVINYQNKPTSNSFVAPGIAEKTITGSLIGCQ